MPQMSPMNWLGLLCIFNALLLLTMIKINYLLKSSMKIKISESKLDFSYMNFLI